MNLLKIVKLFIASSVNEFKQERMELGDFIQSLNQAYQAQGIKIEWNKPENMPREYVPGEGSQLAYNQKIEECHYFFLLVGSTIGGHTKEEFELAQKHRENNPFPRIFPFFLLRGGEFPSQDVMDFREDLKKGGYYVNVSSNMDELKLRMHLELVMAGAFSNGAAGRNNSDESENEPLLESYQGLEPCIYASFSPADKERVEFVLNAMIKEGYHINYELDNASWSLFLIKEASVCMFFLSSDSVNLEWMRSEILYAEKCGKLLLPVYLESVALSAELDFRLSRYQAVNLSNYRDLGGLFGVMERNPVFASCRTAP